VDFSENCLELRYDRDLMDCIITQQQQQLIAARLLVSSQKENDVINTTFIDVFFFIILYLPYGNDDEVRSLEPLNLSLYPSKKKKKF
jgi:hypothetical protein